MSKIKHEDKIEARRLFLSLSKGRSAWADTRGTIIRGADLAHLRLRAVHELINLSTGPAGREVMDQRRNAMDWSNTAVLVRGMARHGEPEALKKLWLNAVAGSDPGSQGRARVMRRVIGKILQEAPERHLLSEAIEHYKELRHRAMSMEAKGVVTKRDMQVNGVVAPKGSQARVNGYGAIWIDVGGERVDLTRDDVRPMRKRDRLRLGARMAAVNEAGELDF